MFIMNYLNFFPGLLQFNLNDPKLWEGIKITDWISAMGVIIGVPVAIVSIFKLFQKNKEHEQQIASFTSMVISLDKQAAELLEQNKLLRQDLQLRENIAKASVKPELFLVEEESYLNKEGVRIFVRNSGQQAYFEGFDQLVNFGNFEWRGQPNLHEPIRQGEECRFFAAYLPLEQKLKPHSDDLEQYDLIKLTAPVPEDLISVRLNFRDSLGYRHAYRIYRHTQAVNSMANLKMHPVSS
ncbi:hypothetical protein SIO70_32320 [Chitinophaga sancti]|uniref:hypothetical protein n=1 Tax=Chitinophaga sancti TaxID=1004 RepID=UPI002A748190|nr:hypothetical protein [Chitinophaga sancti]WPQ63054.1 hypothetical protein SIO70_32320 [Chitinophaga sancti]